MTDMREGMDGTDSAETTEVSLSDVSVLVPHGFHNVSVCDLEQLVAHLDDGQSLEDAVQNSTFDGTMSLTLERQGPELYGLAERVAALNRTGDSDAYWGMG